MGMGGAGCGGCRSSRAASAAPRPAPPRRASCSGRSPATAIAAHPAEPLVDVACDGCGCGCGRARPLGPAMLVSLQVAVRVAPRRCVRGHSAHADTGIAFALVGLAALGLGAASPAGAGYRGPRHEIASLAGRGGHADTAGANQQRQQRADGESTAHHGSRPHSSQRRQPGTVPASAHLSSPRPQSGHGTSSVPATHGASGSELGRTAISSTFPWITSTPDHGTAPARYGSTTRDSENTDTDPCPYSRIPRRQAA